MEHNTQKINTPNERMLLRSFVFCLGLAAAISIDQGLKHYIFTLPVPPPQFIRFRNFNFAFSLPLPVWGMFIIYAIVLGIAVRYFLKRFLNASYGELVGWVLLFAGAFSNVGERAITGSVRDYFLFLNGVFNLADLYILAAILILIFRGSKSKLQMPHIE